MSLLGRFYEDIRYERGRWPLWRWDRNLRYIAKSLLHRAAPWTEADRDHHARARAYLAGGTWRREVSAPATLVAGGDLMWIRSGFREALSPALRARVAAADLAVVNLETPAVPEQPVPKWVYETLHYNAPPAYLDAWRAARSCAVSLVNNHALDLGEAGLARTREVVRDMGLLPLGGLKAGEAVASASLGGLSVGLAAVTYGINHPQGAPPAGVPVAQLGDAQAPEPDWAMLAALLAEARRAGPDLVVLVMHWGFEYEYWPAALQRAHACTLIELGADVIIGSSPHVLQPVELVSVDGADAACPLQARRGGPARFGLVAWSLGNLATIMPTLECQVGALLTARVGRDAGGQPAFADLSAVATLSQRGLRPSWIDGATLTLREYEGPDAARARAHADRMLGPMLQETP